MKCKPFQTKRNKNLSNGIVANGYKRAINGIEAEIRLQIEEKYACEWDASGLIQRWILSRKIEKEIKELVAERSKHISQDALF